MSDSKSPKKDVQPMTSVPMDLPGNSYNERSKKVESKDEPAEEKKKLEPVTKGPVIQKKKGLGSKVRETFAGDDARSVGNYLLFDVIIPAAKTMLADATSQGVERLLFGERGGRTSKGGSRSSSYTSYNKVYGEKNVRNEPRQLSTRARSMHDFDEIIIQDRGEAEEVLETLCTLIEDYGHAKVSDLYELVAITGNYTDDRWGWNDLRTATTVRHRQGYLLDLPQPIPLK